MQKIKKILTYCFTIITAHMLYQSLTAVSKTILPEITSAHVIFDLGGVLVNTHKSTLLWHLGPKRLLCYCFSTGKSPLALKQTLYMVMNSIERQHTNTPQSYDDEGIPVPSMMRDWLSGKQSNQQILNKLTNAIANHPEWFINHAEQAIIQELATVLFTPQKFAATRTFDSEGVNLVKWCKEQGFKVYILSNWDAESFAVLHKQNTSIFALFDGAIISGDHNYLKPQPELYQILLHTFNVDADNCIMIDDRIENIQAACQLGIHGIRYTPSHNNYLEGHNFNGIEKEIRAWARYKAKQRVTLA
jgi:HAD superfamily hydrolase (TIGR01549 family)